jgi:hypothetical protein
MSRFRRPIRRKGDRFIVDLGVDETTIVRRLVSELRELLTDDDPSDEARSLLLRLFPTAYPDDDEMEEEYQRLMRDELVQSKLASFDIIDKALASDDTIDEGHLIAVMQSINSVRLVLGAMLEVTDDPEADEVAAGFDNSPEYALYGYLSMLLENAVSALTTT